MCVPYTARACLNASVHLGLQIGHDGKDFIGDYDIKGCHAEGKTAYFGMGGNGSIDSRSSLIKPTFRPNGFDCGNIVIQS